MVTEIIKPQSIYETVKIRVRFEQLRAVIQS